MEYFISIDNEKRGPYTMKELAERGLDATTLVMPVDKNAWTPAWQIDELRQILMNKSGDAAQRGTTSADKSIDEGNGGGQPTEEMPFVDATPVAIPESTEPKKNRKSSHGCLLGFFIGFIALMTLLVLTCPTTQDHKDALSDVVSSTVSDAAQATDSSPEDEWLEKAFHTISDAFMGKVISAAIDNLVTVDNYFVCSVGKVNYDNKEHIVSFGILKHIFTIDKKDLREAADKYYKTAESKMKEDLQKKAEQVLKDSVIDPAANTIKGMLGSAIDDILGELGVSQGGDAADETDSI
ncbi:DUF4359 domain-containing protein [Prevotella brunnea]|uniref:DUF4359 domain-containing protein n=1 Tax=Prevotella brunnea TaxID=2508867 RepID=A0A5C8GLG9_9BACT|nr:GYF domain-containing protein [Prevotella brunnea]TXJ63023.1 DUF4359 domain-containing protein [Prevotella brunnea]